MLYRDLLANFRNFALIFETQIIEPRDCSDIFKIGATLALVIPIKIFLGKDK